MESCAVDVMIGNMSMANKVGVGLKFRDAAVVETVSFDKEEWFTLSRARFPLQKL